MSRRYGSFFAGLPRFVSFSFGAFDAGFPTIGDRSGVLCYCIIWFVVYLLCWHSALVPLNFVLGFFCGNIISAASKKKNVVENTIFLDSRCLFHFTIFICLQNIIFFLSELFRKTLNRLNQMKLDQLLVI